VRRTDEVDRPGADAVDAERTGESRHLLSLRGNDNFLERIRGCNTAERHSTKHVTKCRDPRNA
jgi:hypothetical protein